LPVVSRDLKHLIETVGALPKESLDQVMSQMTLVCDEILPVITNLMLSEIGPYLDNLQESLERIGALVSAAETMSGVSAGDALRASVVLLHASVEDFLRTIAASLLPKASETALNEIPLVGLKGRPKNFALGKLVQHRGKTVDDVLRESVSEYLDRSSYNSTQEIASLLQMLGFSIAEHSASFTQLEEMIRRRHQIVHRADRIKPADSDTYVLQTIKSSDVIGWTLMVGTFIGSVLPQLAIKTYSREKLETAARDVVMRMQAAGNTSTAPDKGKIVSATKQLKTAPNSMRTEC
jgi:hypothetical protein